MSGKMSQPKQQQELHAGQQYKTMTFEECAGKKHNPIYVFEIENGKKRLTYFGSEHSNQPAKPMFQEIEKKFKKANPQIVLVEGMHFKEDQKQQLIEERKR